MRQLKIWSSSQNDIRRKLTRKDKWRIAYKRNRMFLNLCFEKMVSFSYRTNWKTRRLHKHCFGNRISFWRQFPFESEPSIDKYQLGEFKKLNFWREENKKNLKNERTTRVEIVRTELIFVEVFSQSDCEASIELHSLIDWPVNCCDFEAAINQRLRLYLNVTKNWLFDGKGFQIFLLKKYRCSLNEADESNIGSCCFSLTKRWPFSVSGFCFDGYSQRNAIVHHFLHYFQYIWQQKVTWLMKTIDFHKPGIANKIVQGDEQWWKVEILFSVNHDFSNTVR